MTSSAIDSVAVLEGVIGKAPPPVQLKVIDHLDDGALRWIAASPVLFAGFADADGVAVTIAGGEPGFASADRRALRVPLAALDDAALARPGLGVGTLFLAPGLGETLRVNGRVAEVRDGHASVAVEECYLHCAKALIRSDFWSATQVGETPSRPEALVAASRFMALATADADGRADLSPKGDPAGVLARLRSETLWFADRPGNRRADSFRNIIAQPRLAAALLIPGSTRVAIVRGTARLTSDEAMRATFAVQDKTPRLAAVVEQAVVEVRESPALARAKLWPAGRATEGLDAAQMFADHVKLNRNRGLHAQVAGALVSVPGLVRRGLATDYKSNLY